MSDPLGLIASARRASISGLANSLHEQASRWLPCIQPKRPLHEHLETAVEHWPTTDNSELQPAGPVVYPVLYRDQLRVTPGQFCEITDAAYEAARGGGSVLLVAIPVRRSGGESTRGVSTAALARCWQAVGLPVIGAPALAELPDIAGELIDQVRINGFTRRSVDLPDLLTAAAAQCLEASKVYLPRGIAKRRGLNGLPCISPLSTLCGSDPFGDPPTVAKLRPAGSDPLWFLAFTTTHTDRVRLADRERQQARQVLRARLGRCWNLLRSGDLTTRNVTPIEEPIRFRYCSTPG